MNFKRTLLLSAILLACSQVNAAISIGTHALAEGEQAIATGKNSIAHGTGAVATGNSLTGAEIKKILADNEAQLKNIELLKGEIKTSEQIYAEKLAIYNKVQSALAKIDENNQQINTVLTPELNTLNTEYAQFKPEYDAKVADMNDRLAMIGNLDFTLLSSDPSNGLDRLATELKTNVEQGHSFSLDQQFYKSYIQNYVDVAGKLNKSIEVYANNNSATIKADKNNRNSATIIAYANYVRSLNYMGVVSSSFSFHTNPSPYDTLNSKTTIDQNEFEAWTAQKNNLIQGLETKLTLITDNFMDAKAKEDLVSVYSQKMDIFNDIQLMKLNLQKYYDAGGGQGNDSPQALALLSEKVKYEQSYKTKITQFNNTLKSYEVANKNNYSDNSRTYTFFGGEKINALGDEIAQTQLMNTQTKATLEAEFRKELAQVQAKYDKLNADIKTKQSQIDALKRANAQLQPTPTELAEAAKAESAAKKLAADKKALEDALAALALNDLRDIGQNAIAIGTNALVTGNDAIGLGTNTLVTGQNAIGIGKDSIVTATDAIALGHANTVTGEKSIAIGAGNVVTGEQAIAIGTGHTVGGNRSGTFGDPNTVDGNDSYAFGNNITIGKGVDNVFVMGNNVSITDATLGGKGSVVLGSNSTLEAANPTATSTIDGKTYANAGATPDSVVSIGSAGKERQISHVAAGRVSATSTDAVNGSQLFNTNSALNALSGVTVKYDSNTKNVITLAGAAGTTVTNVKAGALTATSTDAVNGSQLFETNTKVTNNSNAIATNTTNITKLGTDLAQTNVNVTTNTQEIGKLKDLQALSVQYDGATKDTVTLSGVDGTSISNVKAGALTATSTDAVNGSQLHATNVRIDNLNTTIGDVQTEVSKGWNLSANGKGATKVAPGATVDLRTSDSNLKIDKADTTLTFSLAKDLNLDSVTFKDSGVVINNTGVNANKTRITNVANAINNGDAVNLLQLKEVEQIALEGGKLSVRYDSDDKDVISLAGAAGTTVTNVKAGALTATSTDAVNGSQLFETNTKVTNNSNAIATNTTNITKLGTDLAQTNVNVTTNTQEIGKLKDLQALSVQYDGATKDTVTLSGVDGTSISNVKAGALTATSTDAVNGSQLYATNIRVSSNTHAINSLRDDMNNGGFGLVKQNQVTREIQVAPTTDGTTVNVTGTQGDRVITGVAPGTAHNDVSTVGQLNQLATSVSSNLSRIEKKGNQAGAAAMAVANLPQAVRPGENVVAIGTGYWRGQVGQALGFSHASENGKWLMKINAVTTSGDVGGGFGVGYRW